MAWTSPKTWAVGDPATSSDMNSYVRDNAKALRLTIDLVTIIADITIDGTIGANQSEPGQTLVTGTTLTYDTSPVMVLFYVPSSAQSNAITMDVVCFRGATNIGHTQTIASQQQNRAYALSWIDASPPGGSYAYSVSAWITATTTQTLHAGVGGTGGYAYGFLRVSSAVST